MVRNGGTSDEKKFLGITFHDIRILDVQYIVKWLLNPEYYLLEVRNMGDRGEKLTNIDLL
uniref:Uncharacterized protein n=1 Tax=Rhizophagus irregularis (strain DAOM 181602 / DAOM 197198 / MUCL 43194) TaxID=747089 RepID=U9UQJ7_RHIID